MAHFTEEWFGEASQRALAGLAEVVSGVPGHVIEIGAWEGRSTVALANALHPRPLITIDTWDGSHGEISSELAAERDVFAQWQVNVDELTQGNVTAIRKDWRDALSNVDGEIALAFIDAEHSYREVYDNIAALLPRMAVGGIICGDDAHHGPVQDAVGELLGDKVFVLATLWIWQKPAEVLPVSDRIERLYREMCNTPSDIYLHLPRMVDLVLATRAQHVVELGTRTGVSTVAWLYGLEQTGGRLTSVDIDAKPEIGDHDAWTFIRGDDCSAEVLEQLEPADIVFIDTSHLYDHTVRELDLYRHVVKPGGVICLHDTELPIPEGAPERPLYPVKKAVKEFVAETGWKWINFPDCYGFAVISVPKE